MAAGRQNPTVEKCADLHEHQAKGGNSDKEQPLPLTTQFKGEFIRYRSFSVITILRPTGTHLKVKVLIGRQQDSRWQKFNIKPVKFVI